MQLLTDKLHTAEQWGGERNALTTQKNDFQSPGPYYKAFTVDAIAYIYILQLERNCFLSYSLGFTLIIIRIA